MDSSQYLKYRASTDSIELFSIISMDKTRNPDSLLKHLLLKALCNRMTHPPRNPRSTIHSQTTPRSPTKSPPSDFQTSHQTRSYHWIVPVHLTLPTSNIPHPEFHGETLPYRPALRSLRKRWRPNVLNRDSHSLTLARWRRRVPGLPCLTLPNCNGIWTSGLGTSVSWESGMPHIMAHGGSKAY